MSKKFYFIVIVLVALSLLLSACGDVSNGQWTPSAVKGDNLVTVGQNAGSELGKVLDTLNTINDLGK